MNMHTKIEGTDFYKDTNGDYWKPVHNDKQEGLMQTQFQKTTKLELLTSLAETYGTDKLGHGYLPIYHKYLPEKPMTMIEIGCMNGASAKMFDSYFFNEMDVHIIDLFLNPEFVSMRWCRENFFVPYQGSQSDIKFLSTINVQADFIEEDASHNCSDQLITWKHCFVNNLKSGGVYFLEDTHTSRPEEKFYWGNGVVNYEDTPLWMFKNYLETGKIKNFMFRKEEAEVFESLIKEVHIEADEKLIVIIKN